MITAQKNGITRNFGEDQWQNMPKDKFGWRIIDPGNPIAIPKADIIQKKMIAGEVVGAQKAEPDEIISTGKVGEVVDKSDTLPEIKRKPGRPQK